MGRSRFLFQVNDHYNISFTWPSSASKIVVESENFKTWHDLAYFTANLKKELLLLYLKFSMHQPFPFADVHK